MKEKIEEKKQDAVKKLEAMKLLNGNCLPENVSKITGLPIEKVRELQSRISTKPGRVTQMIQLSKKKKGNNKSTQDQILHTDEILHTDQILHTDEILQQLQQLQKDNVGPKTLRSIIANIKMNLEVESKIDIQIVRLLEKIIARQDCSKRIKEFYYEELCKIYVGINQFGNAIAVVRENLKEPRQSEYIKWTMQEERKYKIIKFTKQNMEPSEIADRLRIPTVDVIRIKRECVKPQGEGEKSGDREP